MPVSWPWTPRQPSSMPPGARPSIRPRHTSPNLRRTSTLGTLRRPLTFGGMSVARSMRFGPPLALTRAARWRPWPMPWPPGLSWRKFVLSSGKVALMLSWLPTLMTSLWSSRPRMLS
eukprot:10284316-Alexandrium_andersonii.AAC.1